MPCAKVSKFSVALSTSVFMIVAVFPELDADVLSPSPILKNLMEFTAAVPVPRNLTVPELTSAVNVSCALLPCCTPPPAETNASESL